MAAAFDVESRLAEGIPTVDRIEQYVRACAQVGYRDAELTADAGQIRDWFGGEDGLDLRALDADCAALRATLATAEHALALQDRQLPALAHAWRGAGGSESRAFLLRHGAASEQLVADLRRAGDALAALREELWYLVDGKVAAAQAIDDRRLAERGPWLAAADAVTTGAGDRAAASELIDQEVKPFVDNDIRLDWVEAMRTATEAVAAAFDVVIARLSDHSADPFEALAELGPSWTVPAGDGPGGFGGGGGGFGGGGAPTTPAAAALPAEPPAAPAAPPSLAPPPVAPPLAAPAAEPALGGAPAVPAPGGLGAGLPSVGSGLSALGQQLADVLGGLFGSVGDTGIDPPGIDEPDPLPDKDIETGEPGVGEEEDETDEDAEEDDADPEAPTDDPVDEPAAAPVGAMPEPVAPEPAEPASTPVAVPPTPLASAPAPVGPADSPCEIAMDELPQAGG